jgi:hypothetical protein
VNSAETVDERHLVRDDERGRFARQVSSMNDTVRGRSNGAR